MSYGLNWKIPWTAASRLLLATRMGKRTMKARLEDLKLSFGLMLRCYSSGRSKVIDSNTLP